MLLSRVADSLFWTARYLERAANMVRFLRVSYHLDLDAVPNALSQWGPLVWITGDYELFRERYGETTREKVMNFLVLDTEYANSVSSCLSAARLNAKGLRDQIPAVIWEEINALGLIFCPVGSANPPQHTTILELCRQVNRTHTLIQGMAAETMARGERYHLWQMGTYLERADKTSRMLHVKYFHLLPTLSHIGTIVDDAAWSALLRSLDTLNDYHRQNGLIAPDKVIDLIVRGPLFARSVLFCLCEVRASLAAMPAEVRGKAIVLLDDLCTEIENTSASEIIEFGVHEFINRLQIAMNRVGDAMMESLVPAVIPEPAPQMMQEEISQ